MLLPAPSEICAGAWKTFVPSDVREDWVGIPSKCLSNLALFPSTTALAAVFMASKVLLACPRRGGRGRYEAVIRTLRSRIGDWKAGRFAELWQTLLQERGRRKQKSQKAPKPQTTGLCPKDAPC